MRKLLVIFAALFVCAAVFAQSPVGSISGVVKDPTGAIIPDAAVSATSLADGAKHTATSNDQGFFLIPTLLPGDYRLVIEVKGFRNYEVQRVGVQVGQTARVDANLSIAGDAIAIEQSADALDQVQHASERELAIRNLDRESNLLRNVRSALRRIEDGSFGTCLHCDEEISPKRLAAVPCAPYCIQCQEEADRLQAEGEEMFDDMLNAA